MNEIEYTVIDNEQEYEDAYSIETTWGLENLRYIAQDCAEDYCNCHEGHEDSWPLTFELFIEGESKGEFDVELEMEVTFSASESS